MFSPDIRTLTTTTEKINSISHIIIRDQELKIGASDLVDTSFSGEEEILPDSMKEITVEFRKENLNTKTTKKKNHMNLRSKLIARAIIILIRTEAKSVIEERYASSNK